MGLPTSEVDIANLAFARIGEPRISSITNPNTANEQLAALCFADARQTVLRLHPWKFACTRALCSRLAGSPAFDYEDAYQLPNDFIRLVSIGGENEYYQELNYDIDGLSILINNAGDSSLKVRYVKDVTDVNVWSAGFRRCMVLQLALDMAYKITKKASVVQMINELLTLELQQMASIDGQERPPIRIQRSKAIEARKIPGRARSAGEWTYLP